MSKQRYSMNDTQLDRSGLKNDSILHTADNIMSEVQESRFAVKAKHDEGFLCHSLESKQTKNTTEPINNYESSISQLIDTFSNVLGKKQPDFVSISQLHSVFQIQKTRDLLTSTEKKEVDLLVKAVEDSYGESINIEFSQFKLFLRIVNGLLCKHSIVRIENYNYRTRGKATILDSVDLIKLNKNFITMECLWLSTIISQEPLNSILSLKTKQYAHAMQSQVLKTYEFILNLPSESSSLILQKISIWNWLFRSKSPASDFKKHLVDLELAYRTFEKELLENLLSQAYKSTQFTFPFY